MPRSALLRNILLTTLAATLASCGGGREGETYEPPGGYNPGGEPSVVGGTYVRTFGSRGNDKGYALAALPGGGLAIGGLLARETGDETQTSWLGVLDAAGAPISEQRVIGRDASIGYEATSSIAVEGYGALFGGQVERRGTAYDVRIRFRDTSGNVVWERELDSGRWSGNVELADPRVGEVSPKFFPVYDSTGAWQGVWVAAPANGAVIHHFDNGSSEVRNSWSTTLWYLDSSGTQVSRTRIVPVDSPSQGDASLHGAAVLESGSLALLLTETGVDREGEPYDRRVVRRVGQDGTIGGPSVTLPSDTYDNELVLSQGALLVLGDDRVTRVDISGQRVLWSSSLNPLTSSNNFHWFGATTLVRGGGSVLTIAGTDYNRASAMWQLDPETGVSLRSCVLPTGQALYSLRARISGILRALLFNGGELRAVNLGDDCQPIPGSETVVGATVAAPWVGPKECCMGWEGGAELSRTGEFVHERSPTRVRRTGPAGDVVFDIGLGLDIATDGGFYLLAADSNSGQLGFASESMVQRRSARGALLRATATGLPWDMAADGAGAFWTTGESPGPIAQGECFGGIVVLHAAGAQDCRRVTGQSLVEWNLARGPDGSIWSSSPERPEVMHFGANNVVTAFPSLCVFDELDVGPFTSRVGTEASGQRICRDGNDGRSWARTLARTAFEGAMTVGWEGNIKAVEAGDGGVVVLFTVRQLRDIPGIRSSANRIGDSDLALLKLTPGGMPQWLRVFGGGRDEIAKELVRMPDGGFALLGTSDSFDAVTPGSADLFVVRTGPDGHVARTSDGGDACQACLGSVSGEALLQFVGEREEATFQEVPATRSMTIAPLAAVEADGVTETVRGETNARQCTGNITDVEEAPPGEPATPLPGGDAPIARFVAHGLYGGPTSNPVSNREPVRLSAEASTPSGGLTRFQWDVQDDGVFDLEGYVQVHTYNTAGPRVVRLRVTDASGRTSEATQTVVVDAAPTYFLRVQPVHAGNVPGNRIEGAGSFIACTNAANGAAQGACFATRSNTLPETTLRAMPAAGAAFSRWVGCDSTRAQAEGAPLCVLDPDPDGRERMIEAHFTGGS